MTPAETTAETTAQIAALLERIPPGNDLRIENHDDHVAEEAARERRGYYDSDRQRRDRADARSAEMYGGAL